jgi:hypothetical protein
LKTLKGETSDHHPVQPGKKKKKDSAIFRFVPQHLIVSYNTLRFARARDAKTRILYCMNYFRSIQKRIALDLREFGTRDRVDSHLVNPFTYSEEASKHVSRNASYQMFEKSMAGMDNSSMMSGDDEKGAEDARKMTVFDSEALDKMRNMASVRMYKVNGRFNSKVFSTTPGYPKFHTTFGEPTVHMNASEEQENTMNGGGVGKEAVRLIGRIDKIEFSEEKVNGEIVEEVYVKDDFGIYIMYDAVL